MIREANREGQVTSAAAHISVVDVTVISASGFCSADQEPVQFSRQAEAFDGWIRPHRLLHKLLHLLPDGRAVGDLLIDFSGFGLRSSGCFAVDPFALAERFQNRRALLSIEKLELDVVHGREIAGIK